MQFGGISKSRFQKSQIFSTFRQVPTYQVGPPSGLSRLSFISCCLQVASLLLAERTDFAASVSWCWPSRFTLVCILPFMLGCCDGFKSIKEELNSKIRLCPRSHALVMNCDEP